MKNILICFIAILLFAGCSKSENEVETDSIIGDWSWRYSKDNKDSGVYMRYDDKNNYYRANDRSFKSIADKGKYSLVNNILKTKMEVVNEYGEIGYTTEVSQQIEFKSNDEIHYKELGDGLFGNREHVPMHLKRIK